MHLRVNLSDLKSISENPSTIWVFGYGSLLWKPDFTYSKRETGFIVGYKRRFWQGNSTHRGTNEKVGILLLV